MKVLFWVSFSAVFYAYFGYPVVLAIAGWVQSALRGNSREEVSSDVSPTLSILIPVHNEAARIQEKIENTLELEYPGDLQVIVVSDGSTDESLSIIQQFAVDRRLEIIELPERRGKANALNIGIQRAKGEIVVFSDASMLLDRCALREIVTPFANPNIGCVSGEDRIEATGGEALYGRYELFLRTQESRLSSIVGASGSFYAQRKTLIGEFEEGVAPDFSSVLETVKRGNRAVSQKSAFGHMTAVDSPRDEFPRKVRTLIRGMVALFGQKEMLNPFRFPAFAFCLFSHKLMRWYVPFFLIAMIVTSYVGSDDLFLLFLFWVQLFFYGLAALSISERFSVQKYLVARIAAYFVTVNAAIIVAWYSYFKGARPEVWTPTKRI